MAINKVVYNGETLIDTTGVSVTPETLVEGATALNAAGEPIDGTNPYEKTATDAEVNTQAGLIEQLKTTLKEKAAGSGGDTTIEDGLITRTITEYSNDRVTVVATQALSNCKSLTKVSFPLVTILQNNAFYNCTSLVTVELPLVRTVNTYALGSCTSLTSIKLPSATVLNTFALHNCKALKTAEFSMKVSISGQAFAYCSALEALILRSTELCPMTAANAFLSSSIANGTGYVYVPAALIADYQAATNWSTHAAQFRALEDYTVDGTVTGELDETKIAEVTAE